MWTPHRRPHQDVGPGRPRLGLCGRDGASAPDDAPSALKSPCHVSRGGSQARFRSTAGVLLRQCGPEPFPHRRLLTLLQLLENHTIAAVPLKGPIPAVSVYGHIALRQCGDLDILVPPQHVLQAKELLMGEGYRPMRQFSHAQEAAHLRSFHAYSLVREHGRVAVDLHWTVMPSYFAVPLDPKGLWDHLEPVELVGTAVLSLPREDVLLFLCIHGFKHEWERLGWICDVAELLRVHQQMDWGRVLEQAEALGSRRILLLGLLLASDLLGAALPEETTQRLQTDPAVTRLGAQARAQLFREAHGSPKMSETLRFRLTGRERLRDKLRYCVQRPTTLTAGDWALLRLPDALFPLYYVLRPLRLYVGRPIRLHVLRPLLPLVPRSVRVLGAYGKSLMKRRR